MWVISCIRRIVYSITGTSSDVTGCKQKPVSQTFASPPSGPVVTALGRQVRGFGAVGQGVQVHRRPVTWRGPWVCGSTVEQEPFWDQQKLTPREETMKANGCCLVKYELLWFDSMLVGPSKCF